MITTTFGQTPAASRGSDRLASHHSDAFELGDRDLSPLEFWQFVKGTDRGPRAISVVLAEVAHERIARAAGFVVELRDQARPVYGVNTGVGHFTGVVVPPESIQRLQENLLRSHACGVGSLLPRDLVLAMWLIRLNTICQGHSGTRPETVDRVLRLLGAGVLADVPSRGSVGASGDLCPSAHAALPVIGEGMVTRRINGELIRQSAAKVLQELELTPLRLQAKEGLSLINGTALTTALATKGWYAAAQLLQHANLAAACTLEALHGSRQPFDERVLALHRHPGTIACGAEIRGWLEGPSQIHDCHVNEKWAQDPYSLRCAPQVHGMVWEEVAAVERILADELNAVADNPILLCDDREAISCGNFHGIYVARAADRLAMALTTLAAMSERRINLAMDGNKTGLPDFLIADGGLRSGLMMVQVTAAALVSECKVLSHPASVDSIPTNNDQEDHVSMGPGAGFKLLEIVERVRSVLAIEFLASSVALDLRHPHLPARRLAAVHRTIREIVPPLVEDRVLAGDIAQLSTLIESEQLLTFREDLP